MAEDLSPTALVMDAAAESRRAVRRMLESRGFRVTEAADSPAAIEAAKSLCPDLILMDLNMPVMDGLAATERIRELKDRCGLEVGCNAYLLKPLDLDELESVIAGLLTT